MEMREGSAGDASADQAVHTGLNCRTHGVVLEESNQGRVPELIPIRYGRMLADPFAFLRGSASVDGLRPGSNSCQRHSSTGVRGLPPGKPGLFATPERNLVFDLNDFDETLPRPGNGISSVWRPAFVLPGGSRAFLIAAPGETAVYELVHSYRSTCVSIAIMRVLDVWYSRLDDKTLIATAPNAEVRRYRQHVAAKARASFANIFFPGSPAWWMDTDASLTSRRLSFTFPRPASRWVSKTAFGPTYDACPYRASFRPLPF